MYGLICNPPSPPRQAIIISRANMCTVLKGGGGCGDAHTPRGVTGKGDKVVTAASVATVFASSVLSQQQ